MPKPIRCNFCNCKGTTMCTLGKLLIHVKTSNYLGTNKSEAGAPVSSVATVISGIGGIRLQISGSLNAGGADGAWCTWCIGAPPQLVQPTTHHPHQPVRVCPPAKPQTASQVQANFSTVQVHFSLYMTFLHSFGACCTALAQSVQPTHPHERLLLMF